MNSIPSVLSGMAGFSKCSPGTMGVLTGAQSSIPKSLSMSNNILALEEGNLACGAVMLNVNAKDSEG
jgi:hypothetical protein